jgi:hypothetical protein
MSNTYADNLLDALGAPQEIRDLVNDKLNENQRIKDMPDDERERSIRNIFDRVLFAFQGSDGDAYVARTILGAFQEIMDVLNTEGNRISKDSNYQPNLSPDVLATATDFVRAADRFLAAFEPLASARRVALDLTQPSIYEPPSLMPAKADDDDEPEERDEPDVANALSGLDYPRQGF